MKKLSAAIALLLMVPALVWAADAGNSVQRQFYLFIAPILTNTQYLRNNNTSEGGNNTGIGGEVLICNGRNGVGVGIDLGYAGNWDYSRTSGTALGLGSVDGTYHFLGVKSRTKIEPFLEVGYSLYYGEGTFTRSGINFGGGVNLWLTKHVAPRLEIRYQSGINGLGGQINEFAAARLGVTFR